jgi:ABC-type dipeptide/oligopeptide/nickel transport system permease component
LDFSAMFIAISGQSLPSFLVAPIFILVFAKSLGWFEPALWAGPTYYVIPMVVLGIRPAAVIARLTRASVLEVIHSDYIRTARAKGLDAKTVLFKHVLRNSMIPVLTLTGPLAAAILTGAFIIEQIFAVPGIAKHLIQSVTNRDYPLILGTTLVFSVILVVANLITDLLMAVIDPRVKMT